MYVREILNKEAFPLDNKDLYPGDYIIEFAQNIINANKKLDFDDFEKIRTDIPEHVSPEEVKQVFDSLQ